MLDKNGIIKRLVRANTLAGKELAILKGLEHPGLLDYQEHIYRYVIFKFLLDDEPEIHTRKLNDLAKLSVEKAGRLNPNELELLDVSKHCGATSSFMTKKVLLFLSFADEMNISLIHYNTADIEDTDQLAEIIYNEALAQRNGAAKSPSETASQIHSRESQVNDE